MSFTDEYYAIVNEQKKKKKEQKTGDAFTDAYNDIVADEAYAPVATLPANGSGHVSIDIAPIDDMISVFGPKITPTTKKEEDDRKWFDTGAFDDGYQFGDVFKTILGTATDVAENVGAGIIGMGEKALDAIAYVSPLLAKGQYYQNGGAYHDAQTQKMFNDSFAEGKKWSENFIKKDLYDEEEIAKKIVLGTDKNSVLGEKSDALIQSGGQLLATAGLQAAGVPWFLTTGATSFGSQAETALNDGAGYEQAGVSAAVSAGAEILTEKLSGGIKFGGKTLDDVLLKPLTEKIASKTVKNLVNLGVDAVGEGAEEVVSGVFSNLGTAIYKEKGLEELLFSEEAVDEYIESFIGGAVLGGLGSGVQAIQDSKRIHLTENEQKVVEHEVEKRTEGKTLTTKEENKIRNEVVRDMLRGYISTDTIEEVLGGETYQSWKNTVDSEDALQREYDELGKKQNATLAETTRYNELHQQLNELKTTSQRNALKDQLGSEVMSLIQNDRLAESYNERSRRGQVFEADLTKYDAKQQATIQKAIDSGILNNTNRTHEFVDMIAKITADKGVLFDFTNNEKLKESGFAVDGKTVNGYVNGDTITLNMDSAKARNSVVGHEITHVLEGTELYQTLQDVVTEYAKSKGDYQGRYDALAKLYEGVEGADINAELTADLVGDYLFTDTDFVRNLSVQHRNVFQKIYDEIKYLCKVATAGSKEARELEKVKKAFEDAYRAKGKATDTKSEDFYDASTKYSLRVTDKDTLNFLDNQETVTTYKTMQLVDGKLYPPMASRIEGKFEDYSELGAWEQATEHPELIKNGNKFKLDKGKGQGSIEAAYNPYMHSSNLVLNDQFSGAYKRDNLVTVECEVPVSELTSGYHAEFAKDSVGWHPWHTGTVAGQLRNAKGTERQVLLSRWIKPVRIVPDAEVAAKYKELLDGTDVEVPDNVVTPALLKELKNAGVKIKESGRVKYSLTDSEGVELSSEQQEYFKNSVVRDENGNLKRMYHGTSRGGFNIFDPYGKSNYGLFGAGSYFTDNKDIANSYTNKGRGQKKQVYETYLNITNPIDMDAPADAEAWSKALPEADLPASGTNEDFYRAMERYFEDEQYAKWEATESAIEILEGMGFDGITHIGGGRVNADGVRHQVYIAFQPEQIKNIDNQKPTDRADIRFSLSEPVESYAEIQKKQQELYQREMHLEERKREASNNPELLNAMDEASSLFSELRTLLPKRRNGTATQEELNRIEEIKVARDENIRRVAEIQEVLGLGAMEAEAREIRETKEALRAASDAAWEREGAERENKAIEKAGLTAPEYFRKKALKAFKTTTNFNEAGYLLPDGKMLNFSGGERNHRYRDHREIGEIYEATNGVKALNRFLSDGNIRVMAESPGVDIASGVEPTFEQYSAIRRFVKSHGTQDGRFFVDFSGVDGRRVGNYAYEGRVNADRVLNDIKHYFATGEIREQSSIGKFLSLSNVGEEADADSLSALKLEAAPVQKETVSKMETVAENATVEENLFPDDLGPVPDDPERFDSLDDADMPPEREMPYGEEEDIYVDDPFEDRDFFEVGNRKVKAYMYENPEVKPFFQAEAINLGGELTDTIKAERWYNDDLYYESGGTKGFGGNKRYTSESIATLLDDWHMSYADIEKGINAIIEDHGAENIAAAKKIEFMLNDRLMNGYKNFYERGYVEPNAAYLDLIYEKQINEYSKEAFDAFMANADQYAPPVVEDIAPVAKPKQSVAMKAPVAEKYEAIRPKRQTTGPKLARATPAEQAAYYGQQTMKGFEPKTAKVLTDEPKVDPKKPKAWNLFKDNIVDKGTVFETMSLKSGNRELQGKWKAIGRAESSAQWFMEHGNASTKSLKDIRDAVEKSGKTKKFTEYLYHMHNVDRMNLEDRYPDMENKPVFGYGVTSDMSKAEAAKLEKANPEFKRWAQDVYSYNQAQREMMVDNGLISRETADLWAKMYPHYVPVRRVGDEGLNINVALDSKKTGVNAPVKKATGGNRDILPLFDTMAMRTEQTYKAIAKNRFGVELKNMLGTTIDTGSVSVDEMIDSVDMQDGLLQEGKDGGNPTFTVFENGERVTFEITEEMYDTMKPKGKFASYTNKVLNTMNNVRRGLLTEYNPAFMLTNPIKDTQDVLINSQHPARTYANYPKAMAELVGKKGQYYQEYMEHGGEQNTFFDGETKTFKETSTFRKVVGFPLDKISDINNFIERVPRMAEYIASRKMGRSIDVSMLDAARVTTDFSAGGDFVKTLNRNGFTFLNASVQGAVQQVRNIREAKTEGLKGWAKLAAKVAVAGLSSTLLNHLLWDDDEDYADLSDYVKQNYYVVAKYGDGKFVRIPKGRTVAVIQNAFEQMENLITGNDELDFDAFAELVISNLAPSNPMENNLIAPIMQAYNNETWYGDDLVPSRLQDLPAAEQFDETTDSLSKWLGEKVSNSAAVEWFNEQFGTNLALSPYKLNYLLDQYSGAIGDMFLPMMTQEAERGNNSLLGNMIAPVSDKFTTDSVLKNQNVTDFYSKRDELEVVSNGRNATKEDQLKKVFVDAVSWEMSDLYAQKREIQNSDMSDAEKYEAVREIQKKINALAESGLNGYEDVYSNGAYAEVGDRRFNYYKDKDTWYEIKAKNSDGSDNWYYTQEQLFRDKLGVSYADYWNNKFDPAKNHVKTHYGEMNGKRYNYSEEDNMWYEIKPKKDDGSDNWFYQKEQEVTKGLGIGYEEYWNNRDEYNFAYDHPQSYALAKTVGGYKTYMTYYDALENWQSDTYIASDKDENGDTIYNSRKKKVQAYLKELDIPEMDKLLLYKSVYNSYDDRNYEIIDYLNKSDLTFEETVNALRGLGFDVTDDGDISWK